MREPLCQRFQLANLSTVVCYFRDRHSMPDALFNLLSSPALNLSHRDAVVLNKGAHKAEANELNLTAAIAAQSQASGGPLLLW